LLDRAHDRSRHGGARLSARRKAVGALDRVARHGPHAWRPAAVPPRNPRRPSRHGPKLACHPPGLQYPHRPARRGARRRPRRGRTESVNGGIVGLFSLEMSASQLANRIIAEQTEIPSHRILRGEIDPSDFDRIAAVAREMEALPLYIDETGGISIAQLAARA